MKTLRLFIILSWISPAFAAQAQSVEPVVRNYSQIAHAIYGDALEAARRLDRAVDGLLASPNDASLAAARQAWVQARQPYLQSEVFRFYGGPIDGMNSATGKEGPLMRLDGWPINPAFIEGGADEDGLINSPNFAISKASILAKNQEQDEVDFTVGYRVIEYLLWGIDKNEHGPGGRNASAYTSGKSENMRRRQFLKAASSQLVDDLQTLVEAWAPAKKNYAQSFIQSGQSSLGNILTGMVGLSSELASDRLETLFDAGEGDGEDAYFSDTAMQDFVYAARGIRNVYLGTYGNLRGESVDSLIRAKDADLATQIEKQLEETEALATALPQQLNRLQLLNLTEDSTEQAQLRKWSSALRRESQLLRRAADVLEVRITLPSE